MFYLFSKKQTLKRTLEMRFLNEKKNDGVAFFRVRFLRLRFMRPLGIINRNPKNQTP